jgi:N-acetylglucosamine-6-sulfatase
MRRFPRGAPIPVFITIGVIGALALVVGPRPDTLGKASTAQARPNVLVIESDDQTVESMRVMSNVTAMIGARGVTFRNSLVNLSVCCPSRATFLTGQYAHNHQVWSNKPPDGGFQRFQALHGYNHLGVWLRRAGYYTAMIGKYLNRYANSPLVPPGWSEWHAAAPRAQYYYNYTLNNNGALVDYGRRSADYKTDVLTAKAVGFVNRRTPSAQPFFLWLTYNAPHVGGPDLSPTPPFDCFRTSQWPAIPQLTAKPAPRHAQAFDLEPLPRPPNFNEADVSDKPAQIRSLPRLNANQIEETQRKYRCRLKSILSVDEGVKKVVDALRATGELNNTLIIYTSDNGYFHGEHRIPEGKGRVYEESIRVPLAMRGPSIPQGVKVSDPVINADLAPTVVDAANANPGLVMDGRSLIPIAQQPGIARERELLIETTGFQAIRTQSYIYAEYSTGERELYDLTRDPFQLQSRHDDPFYDSVEALLADHLDELRNCAGPSCRIPP